MYGSETDEQKVDICFQISGKKISVDHGFALYGAISRVLPYFHEDETAGLKLIRGRYIGDGMLDISPGSELVIRLPVSSIPRYIQLAGKRLNVMEESLAVGVLKTRALVPAVTLYSHLVTTKNGREQARFEDEISKQMERIEICGKFTTGKRRTFCVHGKQVVGYSVLVSELTAEESVVLQENGLGGRRKMGCGFFEQWRF